MHLKPMTTQGQDIRRRRRQGRHAASCTPTRSIKGFTTNPTLMRKAGIADYEAFARDILAAIPTGRSPSRSSPTSSRRWSGRPGVIARWGENVYVKIPVTNTRGERRPRWCAGWPQAASR